MSDYQSEKTLVRDYFADLETASGSSDPNKITEVLSHYTTPNYVWRGVYPFREQLGAESAAQSFWLPLIQSFTCLKRRQDIFIAGTNKYDQKVWVMSMGNFMGLFDHDFLSIPATGRLANLRYAEFSLVENGKIAQTGLFVDLIGLMQQAGVNPLPPSTGVDFNYPGPRTHDGLHYQDADPKQAESTLGLVDRMVDDLTELNESGSMTCSPELLERTWANDMVWYGPSGIGATYTIERYQKQHQLPFRQYLADKTFMGHECRFAEGSYACFFGWPNLTNSPLGGWLGLPGGSKNVQMQVVDVYRCEGEKLIENWVLLDLPYWLKQQGLDVFQRCAELRGQDFKAP